MLSAAAAVSAVAGKSWELVNWIRDLCQGVKTVDERAQRLKSGVIELASACESVLAALERTQSESSTRALTPPWDEDGISATSIGRQVSTCQKTLKELEKVLADLRSGRGSRISRHMKLQDRGKEIDGLCARIKTHTDALQMSLQIVTIKIALCTPDFLLRHLDEALQDISQRLAKIEDNNYRPLGRNSSEEDNEGSLVELAQDALRRGTTLYKASIAGSSAGTESVMGTDKATSIGKWIHETGSTAQITCAAQDERSRLAPHSNNVRTPSTKSLAKDAISENPSSSGSLSDDGSSSGDDSQCEFVTAPEEQLASIAEPSDICRPSTDFSTPLNQWNRTDIVSRFDIRADGRVEVKLCTGASVDSQDLLYLKKSAASRQVDGGREQERNKLALHLAVLFQDLHLVLSLVKLGYSPRSRVQVAYRGPLYEFLTPISIAIASRCEPILEVLLRHDALDSGEGFFSWNHLFGSSSLGLWFSDDVEDYTGVLTRLLVSGFGWQYRTIWTNPCGKLTWTRSRDVLHKISSLPKPFDFRKRLIILVLEFYSRKSSQHTPFSPLRCLVKLDDLKTLRFFWRSSDAQNMDAHLELKDDHGRTPLGYVILQSLVRRRYSLGMVQALLERGASLDVTFKAHPGKGLAYHWRQPSLRDKVMRSNRADLKELVAKY